ncbi:phosphotransferase [Pseudonocardia saturnea]
MSSPDGTATVTPGASRSDGPVDEATLEQLENLGLAAPGAPQLAAMVAALLGQVEVEVLDARVDDHPYAYPALTTRGRFVVSGTARGKSGAEHPYAFFVKVVQAWSRSPLSRHVSEPLRTEVAPLVPWRTEPDLYRSYLRDRLPAGLTVPRAFGVYDLDADSTAVWLELVPGRPVPWDLDRHRRAAYLLGRLAASPSVAPLATCVPPGRTARGYADVWLAHNVIPDLRDDDFWRRPLVAAAFDAELRARMPAAVDALPHLLDELDAVPMATAHGDACTRNLLGTDGAGFVMIDFGFWGTGPVGFDLGQLLLGEVHAGERPARTLPELEKACVPAYVDGLRDEGSTVTLEQVRRSHALLLTIYYAIPALPFEHRDASPTPALHRLHAERAAATRFVLDLLDATTSITG